MAIYDSDGGTREPCLTQDKTAMQQAPITGVAAMMPSKALRLDLVHSMHEGKHGWRRNPIILNMDFDLDDPVYLSHITRLRVLLNHGGPEDDLVWREDVAFGIRPHVVHHHFAVLPLFLPGLPLYLNLSRQP